jgi:hypothetical protein
MLAPKGGKIALHYKGGLPINSLYRYIFTYTYVYMGMRLYSLDNEKYLSLETYCSRI